MDQKTFIFIGRSGSGKGTQAKLLMKYFRETEPDKPLVYLQTGGEFRNFFKEDTYTSKLSKDIYEAGERQPDFLAINMWSNFLIKNFNGEGYLVMDGTPRSLNEANALDTALNWLYEMKSPYVIYMNVSNDWSIKRMLNRSRSDDHLEDIKSRLEWFDKDVIPAVEHYRSNDYYNLLEINGEQSIEDVHKEILSKISESE